MDRRDIQDAGGPETDLGRLLLLLQRSIHLDLRVAAPATVIPDSQGQAYNSTNNTVTVSMGFRPVKVNDDNTEDVTPALSLYNVPVCWFGTNFGYVSAPIAVGDSGHVLFLDRCPTQWLSLGEAADPIQGRAHSLADGIFIPGLRHSGNAITPPIDSTAVVVEGAQIKLGRTALPGEGQIALAQALHTYLTAMFTAAPTAVFDGGAAFKAGVLAYLGANPFTTFSTEKTIAE